MAAGEGKAKGYRAELVQVAAAALAAAQVGQMDSTSLGTDNEGIMGRMALENLLRDVRDERKAQELKWGTRSNEDAPADFWLLVIMEQVGETAEEINNMTPERVKLIEDIIALGKRCKVVLDQMGG